MRKVLLFAVLFVASLSSYSQNLSYTCPRDTVLGCGVTCFNLHATFPDLRALGTSYNIKNVSADVPCYPPIGPDLPGPSAQLTTDDKYSAILPLPFTFTFFGVPYTQVVASTNGVLSFDAATLAGQDAHYGILNYFGDLDAMDGIPEDLPSDLYDKALIMGPYHDIDPSITSAGKQVKYEVIGTAPNRKWILSFYRIGLFDCTSLIRNTHQIILHETTGVVEVVVVDKEICMDWNQGRAMIGMQDITQTKAVMAPGRKASDNPWGSIGMNETWRFTPTGGVPLFRKVELLDAGGAVIATGDTTRVDASTFEWTFPNVCPATNNSTIYVVKTTYAQLNDPTQTIYSLDTIRVTKNAFPASASATNTTCGASTGTVTAVANGGTAPFTYVLNPGNITQTTGVFSNLPVGTYTVTITDANGCDNTVTARVNTTSSLSGTVSAFTNISCPGNSDGAITVTPTQGTAPYTYSANGGPSQASNIFTSLAPGTYTITFTDANGCVGTVIKTLTQGSSISGSSSSVATSCPGVNNGTITATGSGGVAPYTYSLDAGPFQASNVFTGVSAGSHTITIRDSRGCQVTINRTVNAGAGITATFTQTTTTCSSASDGTITVTPTSGTAPYLYSVDAGPTQTSNVLTGLSVGSHTIVIKDANNCTGTYTRTITAGAALTGTAAPTGTSCSGVNDGSVTVTPGTVGVYTYTLTPGAIVQNNNPVFTNLAPGTYSVTFANALGCSGTVNNIVVTAGAALTGTTTTTATSCPTRNDGTITITPGGTGPYTFTLNPGNVVQSTPVFTGLAAGTYTVTFSTAAGCAGAVAINPVVAAGPYLASTVTTVHQPVCANINDGSITIVPGGTGPYTFILNPGSVTQTTPTYSNLAPGTYTYSFTSANGCTGTGGFTLTSNPAIKSPSVKVMPTCNGNNNGRITINASGGVTPYQYAVGPAFTYQATNSFTGLIAGTYDFRIKDAAGCTKDTTIVLAQPAVLTASAANSKVATCNGNDGTITVTAAGGTTPYQYSIDNGVNYQAPAIFTAPDTCFYGNIKVKDAKGCLVNTTVTVALNDTMRLELGAPQTICVGSSVTLQPQTNASTTIFTWTAQGQPLSTLSDPAIKNPVATPVDTAIYTLNAQWGICSRQDAIVINVLHKPIVSAGLDTAICNQATQTIPSVATLIGSATDTSGTVNYLWTPSTKVSFPNQAITPAKTDSTQKFVLTVTDNYGCNFTVTDTVTVFVQPPVKAFAGRDTIAMYNRPHQLLATGGVGYLWTPAAPLNNPNIANPLATLTSDTRFTVIVTDIAGCEGYDTVFLKVYEGPTYHVPNAFSPNGDGRNDIFRPIPSGIASTDYFRVFNRFGELLFETKEWLKGWDGTYRGKQQPIGTYVWMVKGKDYNGRVIEMKGTVLIIH